MASVPQRICKYPLLLREYSKTLHDDEEKNDMLSTIDKLNQLLDNIDKNTKVSSDFGALIEVQRKLICPKNFKLLDGGNSDRMFIHKGDFQIRKPNQNLGSYCFLFSDILILTKPKGDFFKVTKIVQLSSLISCSQIEDDVIHSIRIVEVALGILTISFESKKQRNTWFSFLNERISKFIIPPSENVNLSASNLNQRRLPIKRAQSNLSNHSIFHIASPKKLKEDYQLEEEIVLRKEAESKIKELEVEVKKLKKLIRKQDKLIISMSTNENHGKIFQKKVFTSHSTPVSSDVEAVTEPRNSGSEILRSRRNKKQRKIRGKSLTMRVIRMNSFV